MELFVRYGLFLFYIYEMTEKKHKFHFNKVRNEGKVMVHVTLDNYIRSWRDKRCILGLYAALVLRM